MSYFKPVAISCTHYPLEWSRVVNQIRGWANRYPIAQDVSQPLEAKALFVFTVARRLTNAALWLYEKAERWEPVFLDATVLLFPMLELIGYARVDDVQVARGGRGGDISTVNIWAGLHWLRDPDWLPTVKDNKQKADTTLVSRWQIGHLVSLRHYLLHGSKNAKDNQGNPLPIDDIVNYELPGFIAKTAQPAMSAYWQHLRQDDGSAHWVQRLARSDIRPLRLQGSKLFEEGLVDPDIVSWLET
jgi:hypothetical protein